jgi:hypothetical protein
MSNQTPQPEPETQSSPSTFGGRRPSSCSQIYEEQLTEGQVKAIHSFGECWIVGYEPSKREYWEKALWLWAWDRKVVWQTPRIGVPLGLSENDPAQTTPETKL